MVARWEEDMKHSALAVLALQALLFAASVVSFATPANAACPPGTRYDCVTTFNGKQSCGCR